MAIKLTSILTCLCETPGPAGFEGSAAALALELLYPHMDEVKIDTLGNVIGTRSCGKPGAKRVLVEAHIDEIGFVVTGHKGAFLTLSPLGTLDARHLPGAHLRVLSDPPRTGIVACMPPHVLTKAAMEEVPAVTDLALDLGLTEEETTSIPLGTPVVFDTEAVTMGEGLFSAKALDNRATVAAVLLALDRLPEELNVDLIVLFSTQEELGLRGVQTGVFATEPDLAICLDVTFGDQPDAKPEQTVKFGGGAAIALGPMLDRNLSQQLIRLAETKRIPHQLEVAISGTNADRIALSRAGVPTGLISVPLRYMHSATELVNLADLESVANLLAAFLEGSEAHA